LRFNDLGLRDDAIRPKAPLEYRVLALGDSQTLGWGVPRENIWPVLLQDNLTQRLHRPVRVINAGVASYETRQEFRYLQSDGYAFDPDMVLLMFMDNDLEIDDVPYDPWTKLSLKGKSPGVALYILARKLHVAQLLFNASWFAPILSASSYEPQQFGVRYDFDESMRNERGWKASMGYLEAMAKSVESRGLKFAMVHFDWTSFPFSQELDKDVRGAVAPFPVAYAPDWFTGQDVRKYFNSVTDAHPNVEGHRLIAEHVTDFILSQHWLSSPPSAHNAPRPGAAAVPIRVE
jgi:lysophospholipase L1-like esterase